MEQKTFVVLCIVTFVVLCGVTFVVLCVVTLCDVNIFHVDIDYGFLLMYVMQVTTTYYF